MATSWWVQYYEIDEALNGYRLVPERDQEFTSPIAALLHIQYEFGREFVREEWDWITSRGNAIAWRDDGLGVTMATYRDELLDRQKPVDAS